MSPPSACAPSPLRGAALAELHAAAAAATAAFPSVHAGVENTEENRRFYRQMLFTTPGLNEFISGALVFDETLFHKADDGTPFVECVYRCSMLECSAGSCAPAPVHARLP